MANKKHLHKLDPTKVAPPAVIACGWDHQLLDNMSAFHLDRLIQDLLSTTVTTPALNQIGLWIMGKENDA